MGHVALPVSTGGYVATKKRSFGRRGEVVCTGRYVSDIYVSLHRLGIDPSEVRIERQN